MSRFAYVTLLLNADYLPGALALAESIAQTGSKIPFILLLSKLNVSVQVYDALQQSGYFERIINVDEYLLETRNAFELGNLLKRSDLSFTLTKLNVWRLTDYDRVLYLDSDMLVTEDIEHLFSTWDKLGVNDIIASSDSGWPDIFNSGLFVIRPNTEVFNKLLDFYRHNDSFDGADQGILNEYFNLQGHVTMGNWLRLPFTYNCTLNSNYEYLPAMIRFKDSIKVFHFIGLNKPWRNHNLCYDTRYAKIFNGKNDNLFQLWWNTFNNVSVCSYTPLDILQLSGNLQPRRYEQIPLPPVEAASEGEDKIIHKHDEIVNPFLSPVKKLTDEPKEQPKEMKFPTFYYKKPVADKIVDESVKGEAWRMEEGRIDWPQVSSTNDNIIVDVLNPVDEYIRKNPIFPWETRGGSGTISRTFDNALKYEPPAYSISIMNDSEDDSYNDDDDNGDNNNHDDTDRRGSEEDRQSNHLVGFQDGARFQRYLQRVESLGSSPRKVNAAEEIADLTNEIQKGMELEDKFDKVLGEAEGELLVDDRKDDLSDVDALNLSTEDAKIEGQLENSDKEMVGR